MEDTQSDTLNIGEIVPRLKKQNFRMAITVSVMLMVALSSYSLLRLLNVLGVNIFYYFHCFLVEALRMIVLIVLGSVPVLITIQMVTLRKYLSSFSWSDDARKYLYYLSFAPVACIFLYLFILALSITKEMHWQYAVLLLALLIVPLILQFLLGWQMVRLSRDGDDYVGGMSAVGTLMCISSIIFPLAFFVPFAVAYLFIKAKKYAEQYGFEE